MKNIFNEKIFLFLLILTSGIVYASAQVSFTVDAPRQVIQGNKFQITFVLRNGEGNAFQEPKVEGATKLYGAFEKAGQYYVYVARLKSGSINYEIIDGPTEIETPPLPSLGNRISINPFSYTSTDYNIKVNARNTMLYGRVQRKINFYVGEVTDTDLLKKLSEEGKGAYDELMEYQKIN